MRRLLDLLRPSLLTRVALALAFIGLLPVALLAWRLVGINREAMEQQVEISQTRAAGTAASRIGSEIATLLSLGNGLAANPTLDDPLSIATEDLLRFSQMGWSRLGVLGVALVNPAGELVILAQNPDEDSRRRVREMLQAPFEEMVEIVARRPRGTDVGAVAAPEREVVDIRVAAPLPERRGFVWLVADGSAIRDAISRPEQVGGDVELTLAHQSGGAILGSLEEFPEEVLELALNPNIEGLKPSFRTADGKALGAYSPVRHTRWTVLSRQPLEQAHEVAERMERQSWMAVGLVGLGVVLLSVFAYTTTVRPIRELAAAQRRLAGVGSGSEGSEIDQLRASFEALEERLADRSALDEVFLGRYQVRDVIGSGAMGTVFLGYDPKLQRPVALKTIRLDQKLGAEKREELLGSLLHEAVTTAKFNHPNIVAVYDVEDRGGAAFMAMEFVDGESLETLVWSRGSLDPGAVAILGSAVARALATAHGSRLVHRDIKPANILLGRDGSIKVTDFGIAELLSSMSEREDVVFGTPGYLPPETLRGEGYDASGDLFSLGAVLYFCLTGFRPFEAKTVKEVIRKTMFGTITPLSRAVPDVTADLEGLVTGLLGSDKRSRPQSAESVADRLDAIAAELGARWQPPGEASPPPSAGEEAPEASFLKTTRLDP